MSISLIGLTSLSLCYLAYPVEIPILNIQQLQAIGSDPEFPMDGNYVLMQDIDACETMNWNKGEGFRPIGLRSFAGVYGWLKSKFLSLGADFEGTLDGAGHKIKGLHIEVHKRKEEPYFSGIFVSIGQKGCIKNLVIEDIYITDDYSSGEIGVIANVNKGKIENVSVSGQLTGPTKISGIVNHNLGKIDQCSVSCKMIGNNYIGGIVGINKGKIRNCSFSGVIFGLPNMSYYGGIASINFNEGIIEECESTAQFYKTGLHTGGIVGTNYGSIHKSYSSSTIWAMRYVGGIAGSNLGTITTCYAMGVIRGTDTVGGLVGRNTLLYGKPIRHYGKVIHCYALSSVHGNEKVGGLIGENQAEIIHCYSIGEVEYLQLGGGLIGVNTGNVTDSFWDMDKSKTRFSQGGVGMTTTQMTTREIYENAHWDFETVWKMENHTYPYFLWQKKFPIPLSN